MEERNGVVQEVRNLGSVRSEDVYDVAKGRTKQDGLVRGGTVRQFNTFRYDMYNRCERYACQCASR